MAKYREYMKNQLTELLTEFGQIDELFMDYTYAEGENGKNSKDWDAEGIVKLARKLQPQIIINNRLGLTENRQDWDYITPEQFMPQQWPTVNSQRVPWETCPCVIFRLSVLLNVLVVIQISLVYILSSRNFFLIL